MLGNGTFYTKFNFNKCLLVFTELFVFLRHMVAESLDFAKEALAVGAQLARLRGMLLKKYDSHLISKDLINLKQSLTGNLMEYNCS